MNNFDLVKIERIVRSVIKSMDLNNEENCEINSNDKLEDDKRKPKNIND